MSACGGEDFFSEIRSPRSDTFFAKTPAPFPPKKNKLPQRARGEAPIGLSIISLLVRVY